MGAVAAKHATRTTHRREPRLTLVPPAHAKPARRRGAASRAQAARELFRMFAVVVVVISVLGVGRVWLSVQAAEASIRANELRNTIKSERYEGDMLEVRQSALGSPSRIRAIASNAMQMTSSRKVTYLRLDAQTAGDARSGGADQVSRSVLSRMMDLTAGEAEVLLVGSIGLSRAK